MADRTSTARDLGERAGAEAQGWLPPIADLIEGFWDGILALPGDSTTEAYRRAYEAGGTIPDALLALWDFLVGFVGGLFG